MDNNSGHIFGLSPLSVAIFGIVATAAVLLAYHFIVVHCCNPRAIIISHQQMPQHTIATFEDLPSSLENSITELIPTYKYAKDIGLVSNSEDVTCAICLCEFKDGEVIRVLPECLHSFHVSCIDMWLHSHSNCPLCRADTPLHHRPESDTMRLPDSNQSLERN